MERRGYRLRYEYEYSLQGYPLPAKYRLYYLHTRYLSPHTPRLQIDSTADNCWMSAQGGEQTPTSREQSRPTSSQFTFRSLCCLDLSSGVIPPWIPSKLPSSIIHVRLLLYITCLFVSICSAVRRNFFSSSNHISHLSFPSIHLSTHPPTHLPRHSPAMAKYCKRVSLFKIPKEEDIVALIGQYETLRNTAQKDGKSYIVKNEANRVFNTSEERSQGYTFISVTTFNSREDLAYYDTQCAAHRTLREWLAPRRTGFATMHYETD